MADSFLSFEWWQWCKVHGNSPPNPERAWNNVWSRLCRQRKGMKNPTREYKRSSPYLPIASRSLIHDPSSKNFERITMSNLTRAPVMTQPFPFMKLPIELRLEVYRELLRSEDPVYRKKNIWPGNHLHPNILQTCRQVYDEAKEVLYGENLFSLYKNNPGDPNASRVKRARAFIGISHSSTVSGPLEPDMKDIETLNQFLRDQPNLTHLFLCLGRFCGVEALQIAVEGALQRCNSLVALEVYVDQTPLTPKSIAFCWRLDSIIRRNQHRNDEESLTRDPIDAIDAAAYPPWVKSCTHSKGKFFVPPCNCCFKNRS